MEQRKRKYIFWGCIAGAALSLLMGIIAFYLIGNNFAVYPRLSFLFRFLFGFTPTLLILVAINVIRRD